MNLTRGIIEEIFTEELYRIPGKIVVLIPVGWSELTRDEIELLNRILTSVKLSLDNVQVISRSEIDLAELTAFNASGVISFGSAIDSIKQNYNVETRESIRILKADKLSTLDESKKKTLWMALRQMFNLA